MKPKAKPTARGVSDHAGCVCLRLTHPTAKEVCIAGSFNDWHPSVTPMIRLGEGQWAKELALAPGHHEYRFVVDGQWADDPAATELIPNPFGTANAVVEVSPLQQPVSRPESK
jgi:1,4-alpha-glucan branching enzyme